METKEKILIRAGELFPVMGIRSVTMDSIALDLGISKRTIYELFKDKDDLVVQTMEYQIIRNNERLLNLLNSRENAIEALFMALNHEHDRMMAMNPLFLEDIQKYFAKIHACFYQDHQRIREFSIPYVLLERGMREKIFRSDLQIEIVDNFLHELAGLLHNSVRLKLLQSTYEDILKNILLPYFRGICTRKGQELIDQYFENAIQ